MQTRRLARMFGSLATAALLATTLSWSGGATPVAAAGYPTVDGQFSGTGRLKAGETFELKVTNRGGVLPITGVGAVALNVTVTNPTAPSYLTVFPSGAERPTAANLVFQPGQTVPNAVVVKVGAGGRISLFNYSGEVDVIVDVAGWFPNGAGFTGLTPARLLDTRPGYPTIDGQMSGGGRVGASEAIDLKVVGRGGVKRAGSVALNVTAVGASAPSFLTAWPTGAPRPTAANLNYTTGQTVPNLVIARLGADGKVSLFNYAGSVDLVVDVLGWFPDPEPIPVGGTAPEPGAVEAFVGLTPARLLDTRPGYPTIDGSFAGQGAVTANSTTDLTVLARGGVPEDGVSAVALNVTVTNPTAASFLTAFPAGTGRPTAANLNYVPRQTVPNMVIVKVGDLGRVSLYNLAGSADLVVDVLGWFPDAGSFTAITPARLMDSRTL